MNTGDNEIKRARIICLVIFLVFIGVILKDLNVNQTSLALKCTYIAFLGVYTITFIGYFLRILLMALISFITILVSIGTGLMLLPKVVGIVIFCLSILWLQQNLLLAHNGFAPISSNTFKFLIKWRRKIYEKFPFLMLEGEDIEENQEFPNS